MAGALQINLHDTLLVVGNDKISGELLGRLGATTGLAIAVDRSTSVRRVVNLLRKRVLRVTDVAKMAVCEWRRPKSPVESTGHLVIATNDDLLHLIRDRGFRQIILFRAGLIINKAVLAEPADILNIHCASIATHGGLASIRRAIEDRCYDQAATLHRVTRRIDEGEVLAEQPYRLDPGRSYCWNEGVAYEAGIQLALRLLRPTTGADRPAEGRERPA